MHENLRILFLGDIVGRPGRYGVRYFLENISHYIGFKPDVVIANCENASHGFGLTEKNYNDLLAYGIDILTSGNHIWDRKDIFNYIHKADRLIRPLNYPENTPGVGSNVFDINGVKIGVANLLGRVFMDPYNSPWEIAQYEVAKLHEQAQIIIIDFHAEATAEKIAFGQFLSKMGVTAMIGTHTHVQTADEKITGNTAYITDVGYCGATQSVIGMDINSSIKKLISLLPVKYEIAALNTVTINGVILTIEQKTGIATDINRINLNIDLSEHLAEDNAQ